MKYVAAYSKMITISKNKNKNSWGRILIVLNLICQTVRGQTKTMTPGIKRPTKQKTCREGS